MDNIINSVQSPVETFLIANIPDKVAHDTVIVLKSLAHLELFILITGLDDDLPGLIFFAHCGCKFFSKRTGTTSNENGLAV
jgi:hypothetical protein